MLAVPVRYAHACGKCCSLLNLRIQRESVCHSEMQKTPGRYAQRGFDNARGQTCQTTHKDKSLVRFLVLLGLHN